MNSVSLDSLRSEMHSNLHRGPGYFASYTYGPLLSACRQSSCLRQLPTRKNSSKKRPQHETIRDTVSCTYAEEMARVFFFNLKG